MKKEKMKFQENYEKIISMDNLLEAWKEFLKGKKKKKDVLEFSLNLMDNIISLHADLFHHTYKHDGYQAFNISDPKPRNIHKASVRDRLVHHAIYRILYPYFDRKFISDSFSCRLRKGTHKAINRFRRFAYKASRNNTRTCWVLKCDIRKFFANINHEVLKDILAEYIGDKDVSRLLLEVINSFNTKGMVGIGLPLGNLTSQLFVNIYMNEFDQFVKHKLKAKYYIRYADDFVIFSENKERLLLLIELIRNFLWEKLKLNLHPRKISVKTIASGVDFLGWINFTDHRILRTSTKRRMLRRIKEYPSAETLNSYFGLLSHGNAERLILQIKKMKVYLIYD